MTHNPNDKHAEYDFGLHCNEDHSDEVRQEGDAELNNPESRHRDKLLDDYCDTHPGSPMCKVFDE